MLRLLMLVSGEAWFRLSALVATASVVGALGVGVDDSVIFLARVLGAATLGLGIADRACSGPNVVVK
jgi:preprotein translocase subunit SecD